MNDQTINMFDPAMREDPFPTYHRMRADMPVCKVEPGGLYALTRYDDITAAFRDTATYSSAGFRALLLPEWVGRNPAAGALYLACEARSLASSSARISALDRSSVRVRSTHICNAAMALSISPSLW